MKYGKNNEKNKNIDDARSWNNLFLIGSEKEKKAKK